MSPTFEHIYFYGGSFSPGIVILIFLLVEAVRKKLFDRAARKVGIMVLIIFVLTLVSGTIGGFIVSSERHNLSDNPGVGVILVPAFQGITTGLFIVAVFIVLKFVAKCAAQWRNAP